MASPTLAPNSKAKLELLSSKTAVDSDGQAMLGLKFTLEPGWKTYWRSPGASGYSFKLNWSGSKNIKNTEVLWPFPERLNTALGVVNGYEGEVVFPIRVYVQDKKQPLMVHVHVDYLVCSESNCLPQSNDLTFTLPVGKPTNTADTATIEKFLATVPKNLTPKDYRIEKLDIIHQDSPPPMIILTIRNLVSKFNQDTVPTMFAESYGHYFIDTPHVTLSDDRKAAIYTMAVYPDKYKVPTVLPNLFNTRFTYTFGKDHQFYEATVSPQAEEMRWYSLALMLGIAFLGGLILNIMPCVLPILSLKILAFLGQEKMNLTLVRRDFLSTVAGIMSSFLLLAMIMVFFRSTSSAIGWGFQFQQPIFLITLITILTVFAGNLFGFIEFRTPYFLSGTGNTLVKFQGPIKNFFEGTLVTLLATPCTAPFVGTAVGFAFSQSYVIAVLVFITMGIGLAYPYILIAMFPNIAYHFPKPGAWMLKVKIVMAFLLISTALWLYYILVSKIGGRASYVFFLIMVLILFSLAYVKVLRKVLWAIILVFVLSIYFIPSLIPHETKIVAQVDKTWRNFDPQLIPFLVQQNKVVFVDVTADWCLTCKTNELFVLSNKKVKDHLERPDIVTMRADWTTRDTMITNFLGQYNRFAIPFYVVYGCSVPEGKELGPILTPATVIAAIDNAKCSVKNPVPHT